MTSTKPTILFILPWLPYPLKSGGHQAIYSGLMASKDDFNIIITYQEPFEEFHCENKKELIGHLGETTLILPYKLPRETHIQHIKFKTRVHRLLRNLFRKQYHINTINSDSTKYWSWLSEIDLLSMPFYNHVLSIIKRYSVDIVQCEMIKNAALVYCLPENVIKVFVHHEIGFVRRLLESSTIGGNDIEKRVCLSYSKAKEIGTLNLFDAIITLSHTDTEKLKQARVTTEIFSSFAIINSNKTKVQKNEYQHTNMLSFVGPSSSPPNIDAVKWFCENCWNSLLKTKEYKLKIIGNWEKKLQEEIICRYKNITFTGFVDDLGEEIKDSILIVPITIGSGIRMKILEAARIGIPVVSTTIGAEGLDFETNNHCLIADNPNDFINAILRLDNKELCSKLIKNAKKKVEDNYSFDSFKNNRLKIYSQLLQAKEKP